MLVISANILNLLVNFFIGLIVAKFLGPEGFGRFAIAIGAGGLIQVLFFGWLRLAAARFYSEKIRSERPEVRASLDAALATLIALTLALGLAAALSEPVTRLDPELAFFALAFAGANGAFEYYLALMRARFHDGAYTALIFSKNILSLGMTAGVAFATASPDLTLAGTGFSVAIPALVLRLLRDQEKTPRTPVSRAVLHETLSYGLPLSLSLILFSLIPLANRALGAHMNDFAEAGQLALAQDVGLKLILTIGMSMDQLLFQLAVREHEKGGHDLGQSQVAFNMTIMLGLFLPALAGVWLVLPSFERLIVPQEFVGDFAMALQILLPGLACYGLMTFALAPAFQIAHRTWPVIAAAAFACGINGLCLWILPPTWDVKMLATAQSLALVAGALFLLVWMPFVRPTWPPIRDILGLIIATLAMIAAVWPLRDLEPGLTTLGLQALIGGVIYLACIFIFDIAQIRARIGLA